MASATTGDGLQGGPCRLALECFGHRIETIGAAYDGFAGFLAHAVRSMRLICEEFGGEGLALLGTHLFMLFGGEAQHGGEFWDLDPSDFHEDERANAAFALAKDKLRAALRAVGEFYSAAEAVHRAERKADPEVA